MKPIIGIISKYERLPSKKLIAFNYQEIIDKITESNGIPIGISSNLEDIKNLPNIVDGIILQGGDDYTEEEIEIVKYAYEKDIPLLGICLGMQTIGVAFNGNLYTANNHMKPNEEYVHDVYIKKNSKFYEIVKMEKIAVNSRHNFALKSTTLDITGLSTDNTIEIIEDKNKKFFIGIQWHPESLENENSKKLFDYFVKKASEKWL